MTLAMAAGGAAHAQPGRGPVRVPEGVKVERDIPYAGTANPRQTLDLYLPEKPAGGGPLPLVVNIHGGAFRMGDKGMGVGELMPLVASGDYALASINYRLSGEAKWPAQVHDCKAAIRWLRAQAPKLGIDPERIGVAGASAGGHLAAMLGTSAGVAELEGDLGGQVGTSSAVRCVVDQFGPADLLTQGDHPSRKNANDADSPESQLIGGALQENKEKARSASPTTHVTPDDPPFLIFHGTDDPLVPFAQSENLAARLREAGVDVTFVPVEGGGHGGFGNPEVARRIRTFLDRHLRGVEGGPIPATPIAAGAQGRGPRPGVPPA
jgi:acetyl esterase/lipase